MKTFLSFFLSFVLLALASFVRSELLIEITKGIDDPIPIAVVPFSWGSRGAATEDFARVIENDLLRSGQFAPVSRLDMLSFPSTEEEVFFRDWRVLRAQYLLIGSALLQQNSLQIDYQLLDVSKGKSIYSGSVSGELSEQRVLSHRIADVIYQNLTGIPGAFATRLLYIAAERDSMGKDSFSLTLSDSDGERPIVLLKSSEPIMSPSWAPSGDEVAYVSFESGKPAIYRQNLISGKREQLTNFAGLNSSPAWSPDGKFMAMVLSKDGNPDIYLMNLADFSLTRLTRHYAIDTEPAWMPDGESLLFTSDRGGRPQIYRYDFKSGNTERVTFEGTYNARARVAADGRNIALVHRKDRKYHIAVFDIVTNRLQIMTETNLDESPSIAPNGSMVLYSTKYRGRGILAAVSVDGGFKFRLPAREGDVREPAWSPYM